MSAAAAIAVLRAAYPRQDFPRSTVELYARMLARYDDDELVGAVERLIRRSTFLPSIAEISAEVAEDRLRLPQLDEAWAIALRGSLRDAPVEVREAAEAVGGRWSILHSDHPDTVRAHFAREYAARRERALHVAQGAALPPAPETPALGTPDRELPGDDLLRAIE